jgi:hypothetical protein
MSTTYKKYPTHARIQHLLGASSFLIFGILFLIEVLIKRLLKPLPSDNWITLLAMIAVFILFVLLSIVFWGLSQSYILISPTGIEQHDLGFRVYSTWENIQMLSASKSKWHLNEYEVLVLRKPVPVKYDLVRGAEKQTYWISLKEYKMWRYYELGQDLKHYAPHLFEK